MSISKEKLGAIIKEAKDSMRILMKHLGAQNTSANILLLKWPDLIDSYIEDNEKEFHSDAVCLVCFPLKIIAESMIESNQQLLKWKEEVDMAFNTKDSDIFEAKAQLVRLIELIECKLKTEENK